MSTQSGGPNRTGNFIEDLIIRLFEEYGIPVRPWREVGDSGDMFEPVCLLTNPPYKSLFDRYSQDPKAISRTGLVFRNRDRSLDIRIIPRWQDDSGSTEDKLMALFYNAWKAMPEREIWIIAGGDGFRDGAINWLKDQCQRVTRTPNEKVLTFVGDVPTLRKYHKELMAKTKIPPRAAE